MGHMTRNRHSTGSDRWPFADRFRPFRSRRSQIESLQSILEDVITHYPLQYSSDDTKPKGQRRAMRGERHDCVTETVDVVSQYSALYEYRWCWVEMFKIRSSSSLSNFVTSALCKILLQCCLWNSFERNFKTLAYFIVPENTSECFFTRRCS